MGSLVLEICGVVGRHGGFPLHERLAARRRDFPGLRRFVDQPTLFWLNSSDTALRTVALLGALAGLGAAYGGEYGLWFQLLAWVCLLSLDVAGLAFPWDSLLLEVSFLALFLPDVHALPELHAATLPLATVAFMFRWLVIRLMWGFAKVKFIGTEKGDDLYLKGFFIWMPVPNPLGWFAQHAPNWFLKFSLHFMFIAEVVAPGLGLFAGEMRLLSFALLAGLMAGIQLTGNWGYFNLGYAGLCICLLDLQSSIFDIAKQPLSMLWATPHDAAVNGAMALLFVLSILYFLNNTWSNQVWVHWPMEDLTIKYPWVGWLQRFCRVLAPFRILSGYGVFPPTSGPPMRMIAVVEGSNDGEQWKQYEYRYIPTHQKSAPPIIAPHHPRLDHAIHYATMGMSDASLVTSLVGDGDPYQSHTLNSWLDRMVQGVLHGFPTALREFRVNPFPDAPPRYARMSAYAMTPTSLEQRRQTGDWWRVRRVGTLVDATDKRPELLSNWMPTPDLFHPDWVHWKGRVPALQAVVQAFEDGAAASDAILVQSDLTEQDVRAFWDDFVPAVRGPRHADWSTFHDTAGWLLERFGEQGLRRFERVLERYCLLLRPRLVPHVYGGVEPTFKIRSNFRLQLLMHEMVLDGLPALEAALKDPGLAARRVQQMTDESALYTLALLRYRTTLFYIRTFRWADYGRQVSKANPPGILEFYELLAAQSAPGEEWVPKSSRAADGEWSVDSLYEPA